MVAHFDDPSYASTRLLAVDLGIPLGMLYKEMRLLKRAGLRPRTFYIIQNMHLTCPLISTENIAEHLGMHPVYVRAHSLFSGGTKHYSVLPPYVEKTDLINKMYNAGLTIRYFRDGHTSIRQHKKEIASVPHADTVKYIAQFVQQEEQV